MDVQSVFSDHIFLISRDDPLTANLKPAILEDYLGEASTVRNQARDQTEQAGLDPSVYCRCGQCTYKPTLDESVCCKSISILSTEPAQPGNLIKYQLGK